MKIKTYTIKKRESKVNIKNFIDLKKIKKAKLKIFFDGLPEILNAKNLKILGRVIKKAKLKKKQIIFMMGAHSIKCGLSPIIIDLIKKGIITHIATNGASIIHDFEISLIGKTSEDVAKQLPEGKFGMARETLYLVNEAVNIGAKKNKGLGETIGEFIGKKRLKFKNLSIFYNAFKLRIPLTVHVGIGTDIIYQSDNCLGENWGKTSYIDFLKFVETIKRLEKGVVINIGSAVILPEVFLKALNLARNQGSRIKNFTSANFDQILHYRVKENVLIRPGGKYFNFIGHHEIMLPLLYKLIT